MLVTIGAEREEEVTMFLKSSPLKLPVWFRNIKYDLYTLNHMCIKHVHVCDCMCIYKYDSVAE